MSLHTNGNYFQGDKHMINRFSVVPDLAGPHYILHLRLM